MKEKKELNKYIKFLVNNQKFFFTTLIIIISLFLVLNRISPYMKNKKSNIYQVIDEKYNLCSETYFKDQKKIENFITFLEVNKIVDFKNENDFIQELAIISNPSRKIKGYLNSKFKKSDNLYEMYSKATVLISQNKFNEALKLSYELNNRIINDQSFLKNETLPAGSLLYSLNLLRLSNLEGSLKNYNKEIVYLEALSKYLSTGSENSIIKEAKEAIDRSFKENNFELKDFISYKKDLNSSK
ncbi:MAG: hypothetical protein A3F40_01215 [Chlamydiae bacterium RIFCSPHIGHO2_12_FULL_27_8]|nr:MAG: hypothetical protein A3F40_01215 [Chlamydiae bacterium RIFCSPHIGHO2_12_FULL_27_8]